jgi:hypothetical protein
VDNDLPEEKATVGLRRPSQSSRQRYEGGRLAYLVAQRLGVRLEDVRVAERLGLENAWPPLS